MKEGDRRPSVINKTNNAEYTNELLVQFLIDNDCTNIDTALLKEMMTKAKVIKQHPFAISTQQRHGDTYYYTYVTDKTKRNNRRQISAKNQKDLENKIYAEYQKEHEEKQYIFKNYFANWLVNYKATLVKPATIERIYNDYMRCIHGTEIDKKKITDIKRADIKKCINGAINKYELAITAVKNLKSIFNGVFSYAIDEELISTNPMTDLKIENTNIRPTPEKSADTEILTEDELDLFIGFIYDHYTEYRPMTSLGVLLDLQIATRVGEICTIEKADIDLELRKIHIERTESSYGPVKLENGKLVKEPTIHTVTNGRAKKDSNRCLDLTDEAILIIKEILRLQKDLGIDSKYLLADENGNHLIRQRFNDCLNFYCKKVALEPKSSHKIRKTVLSRLFDKGFDLDEVREIAGHRSKSTTLKYYLFSVKSKENRQSRMSEALASNHCPFGQSQVNQAKLA